MTNYNLEQCKEAMDSVKAVLQAKELAPSREALSQAARELKTVSPYNYDAWRLHADLLLNALRQVLTRQMQPDPTFTILAIPLTENDLRDAAEDALRQCARFAASNEEAIKLVDEANNIRRLTWV
jgi:hypothetical protein